MFWLSITLISYFINAGVYVADKHFLSNKIHSSISYAFYVGIWSIGNIVLLYFDWYIPSPKWLAWDFFAGALFLWALIAWYKALHQSEATRVVPIVGAFVPVFSLGLSYAILGELPNERHLVALLTLIAGGVLISLKENKHETWLMRCWKYFRVATSFITGTRRAVDHPLWRLITNSLVAAFAFAAYYVTAKYLFIHQPFIGAYTWTRIGGFLAALALLISPYNRSLIFDRRRKKEAVRNLPLFLFVRFMAVIAFILLNYAISLGDVAIVNALQGAQYVFLLIIALILADTYPKILREELGGAVLLQKLIGVVLIGIGLWLLV